MIISTNKEPLLTEFDDLCKTMCNIMNQKAIDEPDYYRSKSAQKLEPEVKIALDMAAVGTKFENTIEIVSGQRFPDIVAAKYYGIEVKSTKDDKWSVIGGSVAEGTRVEGVEHIYILFGKLHNPTEFKVRRYEECLSDIAVTHSPRYKIDMDLPVGDTIFDKMGIQYEELRKQEDPIGPVVEYYRRLLKPGESLWWINGADAADGAVSPKLRMWTVLNKQDKVDMLAQGFALFPEIFSNHINKYERFTFWLVSSHGVLSRAMRDPFSAGGQVDLTINGNEYKKIPKKYAQLNSYKDKVSYIINNESIETLCDTWHLSVNVVEDRMKTWVKLVSEQASYEKFNVNEFLSNIFL
jgi:hypothetical protein